LSVEGAVTGDLRVVGRDHPIHDASIGATGGVTYATDLELPGMPHAKLLLSPLARRRPGRIDASDALALPGCLR